MDVEQIRLLKRIIQAELMEFWYRERNGPDNEVTESQRVFCEDLWHKLEKLA